ncbi:MAG: hypothetical protein P4L74_02975 [Candidatus Doudnabacteria bacterium]|nr:hypothetical protein [Candidatus Doudnabacteria bacterium]
MKKLLFVFPIVALLAAGCNSSAQPASQKNNQPAQQTQTTPIQQQVAQNPTPSPVPTPTLTPTPTSTNPNIQTYSGSGISFQYDPQAVTVSTQGNKIYLDDPTDAAKRIHTGGYIQVFNKNIEDSLTNAIRNIALAGFSPSQCIVNLTNNFSYFNRFEVFDVQAANNSGSSPAGSCPSPYIDAGSPGFFIFDPSHHTVFVFWRSGAALNLGTIESTLQFTAE